MRMATCKEKNMMTVSLPMLTELESGEIRQEEGVGLGVPFCMYHFFVVSTGQFGILKKDNQEVFFGPVPFADLTRAIVMAMITSGEIQKGIKDASDVAELVKKELRGKTK